MDTLTPHVFGMLHRLEIQLGDINNFQKRNSRRLSSESREYFSIHLPQLKRTTKFLRRQVVLLNLARAKNDQVSIDRQIRLIYGIVEMLRPELHAALKAIRNTPADRKSVV